METHRYDCCICLDEIEEIDKSFLPCDHYFHSQCILQHLEYKSECPLCRAPSTYTIQKVCTTTSTHPPRKVFNCKLCMFISVIYPLYVFICLICVLYVRKNRTPCIDKRWELVDIPNYIDESLVGDEYIPSDTQPESDSPWLETPQSDNPCLEFICTGYFCVQVPIIDAVCSSSSECALGRLCDSNCRCVEF